MRRFTLIILLVLLLCGCGAAPPAGNAGKPLVFASFFPMYDLAQKAGAGLTETRCLIPSGAEPHDWEPAPRDIIALREAGIFFYSGAGFENWLTDVLPELDSGKPVAIETATDAGIAASGSVPHVWLSPKNARLQFSVMVEALKQALPEKAAALDKNAAQWFAEFDKLDEEYAALRSLPKKTIAVTHSAFGYLCAEYGLEQISPVSYSPVTEADPSAVARVISRMKDKGVTVMFYDKAENKRLAETIAAEAVARVLPLNPLENPSIDGTDTGADYFSLMRENLAALKEALA
jgi:zinc transport system substrate-binding protein